MKTSEVRKLFLDYFVEHDHLLVPSSSLVPYRDPSVLLTTAGMQQFKPYFLGMAEPPSRRLTTVQKCFRTTDIDKVGLTARHCTFFEMLGNFSVGDYFKQDAIGYAYEFSTDYLDLEPERIWVSVFEGDDEVEGDEEAVAIWESVGIPRERMVRLPRSDNFWGPPGPVGPCGPCSELYYDRGEEYGCSSPDCRPGCDCDRYVEYWNLVFMQYNMDEAGQLSPLPSKNIDTGAGLERVAALKQDVLSVFLTDSFYPLIELGEELSQKKYGRDERVDVALRVIADHSRAMTFLIADGVLPSNEGRGYVLRRVIRRAVRFSRNAGLEPPFLTDFAERTIELFGGAYPELPERRDSIMRVVGSEEERFNRTLDQGMALLEQEVARAAEQGSGTFPGSVAFLLHDTYGFPVEVTREVAEERGLRLDMEAFETEMEQQRDRARGSQRGEDEEQEAILSLAREGLHPTEFVGYEKEEVFTVAERVRSLDSGRILIVLRESPFYAEAGGQTSDVGWIESDTGKVEVVAVQQHGAVQVLIARFVEGFITEGTRVKAAISTVNRHAIAANHTGTHLLHYALRTLLGPDATQAGSAVRADRFRFDFAYHEPVGPERLAEIENLVNRKIVENHPVRAFTTTYELAKDLGAMALFGEKYGDYVRVVEIDDFSRELCGGTHVGMTSEIGLFKILSEGSVGANVRRIEAVTGPAAVDFYRERDALVKAAAEAAGVRDDQLVSAIGKLRAQIASLQDDMKHLLSGASRDLVTQIEAEAEERGGVRIVAAQVEARDGEHLLQLMDQVRDRLAPAAVALALRSDGKPVLVLGVSKDVDKIDAGRLMREAARRMGGGGGGSSTLARGGGGDPARLQEALDWLREAMARSLDG